MPGSAAPAINQVYFTVAETPAPEPTLQVTEVARSINVKPPSTPANAPLPAEQPAQLPQGGASLDRQPSTGGRGFDQRRRPQDHRANTTGT